MHTPGPLEASYSKGAGWILKANPGRFDWGVYKWDGNGPLMLYTLRDHAARQPLEIGDERWIQFPQEKWDEMQADNARLLAAAYTSYDRHCGPRAIELAEGDLLGELIQFVRKVSTPLDCGCKPCTGDCMSETSMLIAIECMAEDAAALLAKLPEQP